MPRISAVINTINTKHDLSYALWSVRGWVDEIVVVDMHSDDATCEVARSFGARIVQHERLGFADRLALENSRFRTKGRLARDHRPRSAGATTTDPGRP